MAASNSIVGIYELDGKYYQCLGEAWSHTEKQFAVLYKPLYNCSAKPGSFEAHELATSSYERWFRKFRKLQAGDHMPNTWQGFVVQEALVQGAGLPSTRPVPENVPSASGLVGVDRSHEAQAIDFSSEFVEAVKSGMKVKTARVLQEGVPGGEPWLNEIGSGALVWATSDRKAFGRLCVTGKTTVKVADLTDQHAKDEQFEHREAFITKLKQFFPELSNSNEVCIFEFYYAEDNSGMRSVIGGRAQNEIALSTY
mmetsp:Transcript_39726/g.62026  ORF Transcript_39726/g.62026 Transcript_39726/m.62026 type:complete len:254 (-) Transcript_39726:2371-3132(-)